MGSLKRVDFEYFWHAFEGFEILYVRRYRWARCLNISPSALIGLVPLDYSFPVVIFETIVFSFKAQPHVT